MDACEAAMGELEEVCAGEKFSVEMLQGVLEGEDAVRMAAE